MQIISQQTNTVEKILHDKQGRLVRATFAVYEQGGRIKARLLHAEVIEALETRQFMLGSIVSEQASRQDVTVLSTIVSPYFNTNLLFSLGSKPRAPTL